MKKQKRSWLVACCIALLLCPAITSLASPADSFMLPDNLHIISIVPQSEDAVIVESHNQLFVLDANDMRTKQVLPKPLSDAAVVVYSDEIAAVTVEGQLIAYEDGDWVVKGELPAPDANRVIWAQRMGDEVFASFALDGSQQALIAACDTASKASRVIAKAFGNGWFYPINEHALGSLRWDESWLHCVLDLGSNSITEKTVKSLPLAIRSFSYAPSTGLFYFAVPSGILFGTDMQDVKPFSQQGGVRDIAPLKDGKAALLVDNGVYVRSPQADSAFTMTVLGIAPPLADKYFLQTGVKIAERQTMLGNMEDIAAMLASKDASIDLFCLFSDNGLGKIKEKGLFVDLSASPILNQAKAELYPAIARRLSSGECGLMAWPVYMESWFVRADSELLGAYGFDTPATFDELVDLFPKIIESGLLPDAQARMFDIMSYCREEVLTYFIQQYLFAMDIAGERPDFFNPDVLRILQKIVENVPVEDPYPPQDGTESPLFYLATVTDQISDAYLTGFRIAASQPAAIWSHLLVMVVNPFSAHKAEAISYLEFLSSNRGQEAYPLYASMTEPLPNPQVAAEMDALKDSLKKLQAQSQKEPGAFDTAIAQTKAALEQLEPYQYLVDPDSIARYHELAQYLYISEDASLLYNSDLTNIIAQLAQGNLGLEGFAERMNQIIRLIYLERGL
ncbi:MAG: hypothetical protein ACOX58_07865 [Christensenellales bacterium]|jgi:ABC-type glycerol-3-phosphate transport system substrate-binding protein